MTDDPTDVAGTEGARHLLTESEAVLEDLISGFREMSARLANDEMPTSTDVSKARSALATMRAMILDEVRRHEARVLQSEKHDETAPLDFDALRAQIGRQLDSIRNTR